MEFVKGRILDGGEVLHENLEIALNLIDNPSGQKQYQGSFHLPPEQTKLISAGAFQLQLEDGRSGECFTSCELQDTGIKIMFVVDGHLC